MLSSNNPKYLKVLTKIKLRTFCVQNVCCNISYLLAGGIAGAARKISPKASGATTPAKGIAGAASKLGAAATKKKGGLASRLSKMQKDASFGPSSSLGVCNLA